MRFLILLLLLSSSVMGQLDVDVRIESYAEYDSPPRLIGNTIYFASKSKVSEGPMAYLTVKGPADSVRVKAKRQYIVGTRIVTERAKVEKIGPREFAVKGKGTFAVEVTGINKNGDDEEYPEFDVDLGDVPKPDPGPDPKPDPTPTPSVPSDSFNNIGQRVAVWAKGLPKTKEVSAVYAKYAALLAEDEQMTIPKAFNEASMERIAILGADGPKYNNVVDQVNADIKTHGAMSKGVIADYLKAIAAGYAGAN